LHIWQLPIEIWKNWRKIKKIEADDRLKPNNAEWNEKQSRETLKEHGITNKHEQDQYIGSDGKLNTDGHKKTPFKGSSEDMEAAPSDMSDAGNEQIGNIPEMYESPDISDTTGILDDTDDLPVIGAVAAELLPGTRFLKPMKDLADGDTKKAAVGTATRIGEIFLAPLKLGYAAMVGICSEAYKLAGIDEDYTGFVNGVKLASKNWAETRDEIEDTILGRETKSQKEERIQQQRLKEMEEREKRQKRILEDNQRREEIRQQKQLDEHKRTEAREKSEEYHQLLAPDIYFDNRDDRKDVQKSYKIYKAKDKIYSLIDKVKELQRILSQKRN